MISKQYREHFYDRWTWGGVITFLAIALFVVVPFFWSSRRCADVQEETGVSTKWSILSGCYVQLDGKWVPEERWRTIKQQ